MARAAARSIRRMLAYDQSTGFRVPVGDLRLDPERGIYTTDPDLPNPQKYLRPPGPDGVRQMTFPPLDRQIDCTIAIGRDAVPGYPPVPVPELTLSAATSYWVPSTIPDTTNVLAGVPLTLGIGGYAIQVDATVTIVPPGAMTVSVGGYAVP